MADFPQTRASLLVRLRDSLDERAWSQFLELYGPLVYRFVRRQGLQDADASDVSQDILHSVSRSVGRLDYDPARGAFRNWLFTIVRRKLSAWRLKQSRRERGSGDSGVHQLLEQCATVGGAESDWEERLATSHVYVGLYRGSAARERVDVAGVLAAAVDNQPGKLVAEELGISVAAVYLARSRVLARLQESVRLAQEP